MPKSEAQKRAQQNYEAKTYDIITFKTRKGKSSEYTEAAATMGLGKMEMIRRAVDAFIENHATKRLGELNQTQPAQIVNAPPKITGDEKRLVDAFKNLSPKAQKTLLKFLDALQD